MLEIYENWEKLVRAVHKREDFKRMASKPEPSSSSSSTCTSIGGSSDISITTQSLQFEWSRRTYSHVENDFVGLNEEVEELIDQLLNEDRSNSNHVISIIGKGGIGKTALAKRIYRHVDIRDHFHTFAWVKVSKERRIEDVLCRILCKLEPEKREEFGRMTDRYELTDMLFQVQKTKKCLIVLDNVCGTDDWDRFRLACSCCKSGSKVLVTTREKDIVRHMDRDTSCHQYEQRCLNEEESWELFQKKAFDAIHTAGENRACSFDLHDATLSSNTFHSCRSDIEEEEFLDSLDTPFHEDDIEDIKRLGREMVLQCGGLPLAIVLLRGILATKSTLSDWIAVKESFDCCVRQTCMGEIARVYEKLAINYDMLPYQVKQCFWYLGNFPEYYTIPARKLSHLWAAEGFISSSEENESSMQIAENILTELEKKYLVRVQRNESTSRLKYCKLHEFIREICIFRGSEENLRERIPLTHESENSFGEMILISKQNIPRVRSALVYSKSSERKDLQSKLKWLLDRHKLLRVLDLERFDFGKEICKSIGNSVQLRYLSFRDSRFTKLPSSIGNLKFLQTLDLRIVGGDVYLSIPDVLWKLNDMKHLYLPQQQSCTNRLQLGSLRNLEVLKNFDPQVSEFTDVPKLTKLKTMAVIFHSGTETSKAINKYLNISLTFIQDSSICVHHNFNSTKDLVLLERIFKCVHVQKLNLVGQIEKLPEDCQLYQQLTKLTLRNSNLKEDPLAILQRLPKLLSLTLCNNAYVGSTIRSSAHGFSELRKLQLQGLGVLEEWVIEDESMPNLQHIRIANCINLRNFPQGIKFLGELRAVEIVSMPEAFKQSVGSVQVAGGNNIYNITYEDNNQNYCSESTREQGGGSNRARLFRNFSPSIPREWQIVP